MKLEPGQMIRDYQIIRPIGEGGMGEVYLANEVLLERQVAIKRLNPIYTRDPQFIQRFRNEARIQAQLTHENIVQLITFFSEADTHYMVLEYAPGITLRDLIQQTGPIPEQRALGILRQITAAQSHAHSKGIIHRDIKPSNIMIDTEHGDRVKIMDFGIARLMTDGHLTRTGTKMGTIMYMSPEQVLALKDIDHRSDVYSLGVVFYEMLCGKTAYQVDTESDFLLQKAIVDTEISDPREIYAHISDETVKLLAGMTVKDREVRIGLNDVIGSLSVNEVTNKSNPTKSGVLSSSQGTEVLATQETEVAIKSEAEQNLADLVSTISLLIAITIIIEQNILLLAGQSNFPVFIASIVVFSLVKGLASDDISIDYPVMMLIYALSSIVATLWHGWLYKDWSAEVLSLIPSYLFLGLQILMACTVVYSVRIYIRADSNDELEKPFKRMRIISYLYAFLSIVGTYSMLFIFDL